MGYVVCEKCGGYYQLKEGESAEDFQECQCGGKIKYADSIDEIKDKIPKSVVKEKNKTKKTLPASRRTGMGKISCPKCGAENQYDSVFCRRCGTNFKSPVREHKEKSRTIELVLGIVGGIFGLLGGVFAVLFGIFASEVTGLGISAILASIVGIAGSAYVLKDPKWGGIILVISAVWLLISISLFGVLGAVLLGLAGLLALFR